MKTINKKIKPVLFLFCGLLFFSSIYSCKKEGTGGNSTIKGIVKHHNTIIPTATVYIKYGATEFPGENATNYDNQITTDAGGNYEFTGLVKGDYYLYSYGYDAAIGENVKGGISINVKRNKTVEKNIPVTE